MKWYYSKRGDSGRRGIVDHDGLVELVQRGDLDRKDLVFSESTGFRWVSAGTIEGLFVGTSEEGQPVPSANTSVPEDPGPVGDPVEGRGPGTASRGKSLAAAAVIGIVAIIAVIIVGRPDSHKGTDGAKGGEVPDQETPVEQEPVPVPVETNAVVDPLEVARTNEVSKLKNNIEWYLRARRPADAAVSVKKLREYDEDLADTYDGRVSRVRGELKRCEDLTKKLQGGVLQQPESVELVRLYGLRGNVTGLVAQAGLMMDERDLLSPGLALGVARVASVADARALMVRALNEFTSRVTEYQSLADCLAAVRLYADIGEGGGCLKLLNRCIEDRPDSAELRLELAALQAGGTDSKTALKTLKEAVKLGGDRIAVAAGKDSRFGPLKDERSFKRLVDVD